MVPKGSIKKFVKRKSEEFRGSKLIRMKDIGRRGWFYFRREAWTFLPQSNLKDEKVFIIERLRKSKKEGKIAHSKTWKKGRQNIESVIILLGELVGPRINGFGVSFAHFDSEKRFNEVDK